MRRMPDPARVAVANNYPIDEARRLWAEGLFPDFHLYGGAHLEAAGYDVQYVGLGARPTPRTVAGSWVQHHFGMRVPQLRVVRADATLVVAAEPSVLATLGWLRARGLWRRPMVVVAHPSLPPHKGVLSTALRGYDVVLTMSRLIHDALLNDLGRSAERTVLAPCGPDLAWRGYAPVSGDAVVSSGKTHRDEGTLLSALAATGLGARVHTLGFTGERRSGAVVHVGRASYPQVLQDLRAAGVVAIPLRRTDGTFGLTELNDALALGKPVIMTRNPFIDVDVERVGCGVVVDEGDREGWRAALERLRDPGLRAAMGARGRVFAESRWNSTRFGEAVEAAVRLALRG